MRNSGVVTLVEGYDSPRVTAPYLLYTCLWAVLYRVQNYLRLNRVGVNCPRLYYFILGGGAAVFSINFTSYVVLRWKTYIP
jgi:hypothetical protein